jgi:protein-L-isoaspartate(D-aspartate) O-methyltransferase
MQDQVSPVEPNWTDLRRAMVDNQIRTYDVTDQRLLDVLYRLPREAFLPDAAKAIAYSDAPITLPAANGGETRILMPPLVLAKLIQNARLQPSSRCLVVASATGYAAAILASLASSVVALDSDQGFADIARKACRDIGLANIDFVVGPMPAGHADAAPYDVILVNGAVESGLEALLGQLAPDGSLVTLDMRGGRASRYACKAMRYDNVDGAISARSLFDAGLPVLREFRAAPSFVF